MSTTYLDLVNKCLRKLNEVPLTAANFSTASGFSQLTKDAINYAIDDINQAQFQWPFNFQSYEQVCTVNQAQYDLPTDTSVVDWSTFFLKQDDTIFSKPRNLDLIDYNEWNNRFREQEENSDFTATSTPERVYRTKDLKFGLSPVPDNTYTIQFDYWAVPTALDLATDTCNIPSRYDHVIVNRAMNHLYDFRGNIEQAGMAYTAYRQGLKQMRTQLINTSYNYAYDTRSGEVTPRASVNWSR